MAHDVESLNVEITPEIKAFLEREARLHGMDESSYASRLLMEYLKSVGKGEGGDVVRLQ
jgi:hypothetical protein